MARRIAVAGASGLVGANIVKAALARGYFVSRAMRNVKDAASHLIALPGAAERLTLASADMAVERSFDEMVDGVDGVFIACLIPVYAAPDGTPARELDDSRGWADIILPTVNGCLNIMHSAIRAGVKDIVICSSTSSTNPVPPVPVKNEVDNWSDPLQQCREKKYTSATKAVMERQAMALAARADRLGNLTLSHAVGAFLAPPRLHLRLQAAASRLRAEADAARREGPARCCAERLDLHGAYRGRGGPVSGRL